MSRQLLVKIHLYLATFLTPILLLIATSGGLYLLGYKGNVERQQVYQGAAAEINLKAEDKTAEIKRFLTEKNLNTNFEYVKDRGTIFQTRPTSKDYYQISIKGDTVTVVEEKPDFVKSMVELHKGHGPSLFKTLQQLTAIGLTFILLSGLWIALVTPPMRKTALLLSGSGLAVILVLIFL